MKQNPSALAHRQKKQLKTYLVSKKLTAFWLRADITAGGVVSVSRTESALTKSVVGRQLLHTFSSFQIKNPTK